MLIMSITKHIEAICLRMVPSAPQGHERESSLTTMLTIASLMVVDDPEVM